MQKNANLDFGYAIPIYKDDNGHRLAQVLSISWFENSRMHLMIDNEDLGWETPGENRFDEYHYGLPSITPARDYRNSEPRFDFLLLACWWLFVLFLAFGFGALFEGTSVKVKPSFDVAKQRNSSIISCNSCKIYSAAVNSSNWASTFHDSKYEYKISKDSAFVAIFASIATRLVALFDYLRISFIRLFINIKSK